MLNITRRRRVDHLFIIRLLMSLPYALAVTWMTCRNSRTVNLHRTKTEIIINVMKCCRSSLFVEYNRFICGIWG